MEYSPHTLVKVVDAQERQERETGLLSAKRKATHSSKPRHPIGIQLRQRGTYIHVLTPAKRMRQPGSSRFQWKEI